MKKSHIALAGIVLLVALTAIMAGLLYFFPPKVVYLTVEKTAAPETAEETLAKVGAENIGISTLPIGNYTSLGLVDKTPEIGSSDLHNFLILVQDQAGKKWSVAVWEDPNAIGLFFPNFRVPRLGTTEFRRKNQ